MRENITYKPNIKQSLYGLVWKLESKIIPPTQFHESYTETIILGRRAVKKVLRQTATFVFAVQVELAPEGTHMYMYECEHTQCH